MKGKGEGLHPLFSSLVNSFLYRIINAFKFLPKKDVWKAALKQLKAFACGVSHFLFSFVHSIMFAPKNK